MQLGGVAMAENTDQTVNIDKLVGLCSYVTMQKVLSEYYLTPVGESFRTVLTALAIWDEEYIEWMHRKER